MQELNLPRALSAGDPGRNVSFNKQTKELLSALPGHANSCCIIKSKCGWQHQIMELIRAVVGFRTAVVHWKDHPWTPWVLMVSPPPCSTSCAPALLLRHPALLWDFQLSQDGKLLLRNATAKICPALSQVPLSQEGPGALSPSHSRLQQALEHFPLEATTPRGVILPHTSPVRPIHVPRADSCMRSPSKHPSCWLKPASAAVVASAHPRLQQSLITTASCFPPPTSASPIFWGVLPVNRACQDYSPWFYDALGWQLKLILRFIFS